MVGRKNVSYKLNAACFAGKCFLHRTVSDFVHSEFVYGACNSENCTCQRMISPFKPNRIIPLMAVA
jgi:hypothetical protein